MYYSELVKKACAILYNAQKNDVDELAAIRCFHPFDLATQMDDANSVCTALLHDVIEDHGDRYSFDDLAQAGFPDAVLRALRLLDSCRRCAYMDYVKALAKDPIARRVKLADLRHNTDIRAAERRTLRKTRPVSAGNSVFGRYVNKAKTRNVAPQATKPSFGCATM